MASMNSQDIRWTNTRFFDFVLIWRGTLTTPLLLPTVGSASRRRKALCNATRSVILFYSCF